MEFVRPKGHSSLNSSLEPLPKVPIIETRMVTTKLFGKKNIHGYNAASNEIQQVQNLPVHGSAVSNIDDGPKIPPEPMIPKLLNFEVPDISIISNSDLENESQPLTSHDKITSHVTSPLRKCQYSIPVMKKSYVAEEQIKHDPRMMQYASVAGKCKHCSDTIFRPHSTSNFIKEKEQFSNIQICERRKSIPKVHNETSGHKESQSNTDQDQEHCPVQEMLVHSFDDETSSCHLKNCGTQYESMPRANVCVNDDEPNSFSMPSPLFSKVDFKNQGDLNYPFIEYNIGPKDGNPSFPVSYTNKYNQIRNEHHFQNINGFKFHDAGTQTHLCSEETSGTSKETNMCTDVLWFEVCNFLRKQNKKLSAVLSQVNHLIQLQTEDCRRSSDTDLQFETSESNGNGHKLSIVCDYMENIKKVPHMHTEIPELNSVMYCIMKHDEYINDIQSQINWLLKQADNSLGESPKVCSNVHIAEAKNANKKRNSAESKTNLESVCLEGSENLSSVKERKSMQKICTVSTMTSFISSSVTDAQKETYVEKSDFEDMLYTENKKQLLSETCIKEIDSKASHSKLSPASGRKLDKVSFISKCNNVADSETCTDILRSCQSEDHSFREEAEKEAGREKFCNPSSSNSSDLPLFESILENVNRILEANTEYLCHEKKLPSPRQSLHNKQFQFEKCGAVQVEYTKLKKSSKGCIDRRGSSSCLSISSPSSSDPNLKYSSQNCKKCFNKKNACLSKNDDESSSISVYGLPSSDLSLNTKGYLETYGLLLRQLHSN